MAKKNILVIVEGEKKDVNIAKMMFKAYELDASYDIVTYKTNIYVLYNQLFVENDPEDMELLQVLKQNETSIEQKKLLDKKYTDILLLFDFEPHDSEFSIEKIQKLQDYFSESTDMGKLYIHYPMIEAFFHLENSNDVNYRKRKCTLQDLKEGRYKEIVAYDTKNKIYNLLTRDSEFFKQIINKNLEKIYYFINNIDVETNSIVEDKYWFEANEILEKQVELLTNQQCIAVFSTVGLFVYEYNPNLLLL